jgi:spore coat protein CotH
MGLYTLNLHKDDDLYRLKKEEQEALLICNAQTTEESLFLSTAAFAEDYSSDWEVEFCGTEDESWAKESFNQLISFVMNSNDQEFRENLGNYLDTDAAVDYLLFIYALGLQNSGAKDLVLVNYDGQWIPSAFDMEEAFGLDENNGKYLKADDFVPTLSDGGWSSNTGSLLWDRLLNNYTEQILDRYHMLRSNSFSEDYMIKCVHDYFDSVPEAWYDEDFYLYPDRPVKDNEMIVQIEKYIKDRMQVLDRVFGGEDE